MPIRVALADQMSYEQDRLVELSPLERARRMIR